jgi:hypothetical protein
MGAEVVELFSTALKIASGLIGQFTKISAKHYGMSAIHRVLACDISRDRTEQFNGVSLRDSIATSVFALFMGIPSQ